MKDRYRHRAFFPLTLLLLLLFSAPALAQDRVTDDEVNDVARGLYCPVCENTPLDVCPTQACEDWREIIREQLAEGKSEEEIEQYFVQQYGVRVLAEPPQRGFNLLVWLLPILAVVLGVFVFGYYLTNIREAAGDDGSDTLMVGQAALEPPSAADSDDYLSRVEKEVREE